MFGPCEHADEAPDHELETPLRVLCGKIDDGWLFSQNELQLRYEIQHQQSVRAQRVRQRLAPLAQLGFWFAEERSDQPLKRLRESRVGNVRLVLVELAGREQPARRHEHLVQFVHDGRFANARVPGDEYQRRIAGRYNLIKGGKQGLDLAGTPIKLLGDHQPI